MSTVTLEQAKARLDELIARLQPGEEILITEHGKPLAQVKKAERASWPCKAGSYRKAEFWMAPDFDAPFRCKHRIKHRKRAPGQRGLRTEVPRFRRWAWICHLGPLSRASIGLSTGIVRLVNKV